MVLTRSLVMVINDNNLGIDQIFKKRVYKINHNHNNTDRINVMPSKDIYITSETKLFILVFGIHGRGRRIILPDTGRNVGRYILARCLGTGTSRDGDGNPRLGELFRPGGSVAVLILGRTRG